MTDREVLAARAKLNGFSRFSPEAEFIHQNLYRDLPDYPLWIWPAALREYLSTAAATIGAPADMAAVPMAAILAAVIGNRRPVLTKRGYPGKPALWTMVIADSATGKSPMLDVACDLIVKLQSDAVYSYQLAMNEYEETMAAAKKGEKHLVIKPQMEHFISTNATMEWFAPAAASSPGIVMERDELLGWLRDMDAYRSGKGGDRQTWLTLWSGGMLKVDRKGAETIFAPNPVVCVTGGIQPGKFPELARDAAEDGFMARFLISLHPPRVPGLTRDEMPEDALEGARELVSLLRQYHQRDPVVYSAASFNLLEEWDRDNAPKIEAADRTLRPMLGKMRGQVTKLAALLHCVHDPEGRTKELNDETLAMGIELAEYHRAHGIRAYELLGITADAAQVGLPRRIVWALRRNDGQATTTELYGLMGNHVQAPEMARALDDLEIEGVIESTKTEGKGRPGRVYRLRAATMSEVDPWNQ